MSVVIDIGCARYGDDHSIERLIDLYHPERLYGFDPNAFADAPATINNTSVDIHRVAAWTHDGHVRFVSNGNRSHVTATGAMTPCIDLARFIRAIDDTPTILKIDAEGSEYNLLPHLVATDTDLLLDRAIIEWHCTRCGTGGGHRGDCRDEQGETLRAQIEKLLRCPLEEWTW